MLLCVGAQMLGYANHLGLYWRTSSAIRSPLTLPALTEPSHSLSVLLPPVFHCCAVQGYTARR